MTRGLHTHRFKDNPEEQRFAEAWDCRASLLGYLLQRPEDWGNGRPPDPSEHDRVVAATVIQWLGSPVGQGFLRDLGYERTSK